MPSLWFDIAHLFAGGVLVLSFVRSIGSCIASTSTAKSNRWIGGGTTMLAGLALVALSTDLDIAARPEFERGQMRGAGAQALADIIHRQPPS